MTSLTVSPASANRWSASSSRNTARPKTRPSVRLTAGSPSCDAVIDMSIQDTLSTSPRDALFEVLDGVRAGMLGLLGGGDGLQPMTHFPDAEAGVIWFISSTETDLVQSLGLGEDAQYVVISTDHDAHVSLRGKLYHVQDSTKLDALWGPFVSAWFEGGRADPRVALLRLDPEDRV
ncbi:MAG: hypothetical protein EAZ40_02035 [Rhodobacterales bacterium]|nr:MAG: hypothetical protein EAZ40_02035 [Rhodobacterales bacterium]